MGGLSIGFLVLLWIAGALVPNGVGAGSDDTIHLRQYTEPVDWGPFICLVSSNAKDHAPFKPGDLIHIKGTIDNGSQMRALLIWGESGLILEQNGSSVDFKFKVPAPSGMLNLFTWNIGATNATIELTITNEAAPTHHIEVQFGVTLMIFVIFSTMMILILNHPKK